MITGARRYGLALIAAIATAVLGSTSGHGRLGYARWAENVTPFQTAQQAVRFWSTSRPHRASMLNCAFTDAGLAVAHSLSGRLYWTQAFGG